MTDDEIKEFIATHVSQAFNDPGQFNITLYNKSDDSDGFALVRVQALVTHPQMDNVGVELTFRIPKL